MFTVGAAPYQCVAYLYTMVEILNFKLVTLCTVDCNAFRVVIRVVFLVLLMKSIGALDRLTLYGIKQPLSRLRDK